MRKWKIIFLALISLIVELRSENMPPASIIVKTHIYNDGVAIRWTPANLYSWRKWSNEGYRLERHTIGKNGKPVSDGESLVLGGGNIMPLTEIKWQEYAKTIPEANLIQYCMRNDTGRKLSDKELFLSSIEEDDQCYIFSMLAMQLKFELAIAGGVGFIDKTTRENEIYLYKLYPVNSNKNDTQVFVVDMGEVSLLPVIDNFSARLSDNRIFLQWNTRQYNSVYFGFRIERSIDGGINYLPVNELPVVPVLTEGEVDKGYEILIDTISQYYKHIHYRVRGMSYFGQYGLPSIADSIIAFPETHEFPRFLEVNSLAGNMSSVGWQFERSNEELIKGFKVLISDSSEGEFVEMSPDVIDAGQRIFEFKPDRPAVYIKVAAITLNNTIRPSFPLMVQMVDSIPPLPPVHLSVIVDTSGIAYINWGANKEKDFMAYIVFKGNNRDQEFSSITPHYYKDTFIRDTLFNKMLRDSIYYKLIAIDERFNESLYSNITAAFIPNKIPPAPPLIFEITPSVNSVFISWYPSSSNDIAYYNLIREDKGSGEQEVITIDKSRVNFKDSMVVSGETYSYTLEAVDNTALSSKKANPFEVKIPSEKIMPVVNIKAVMNDTTKNRISIFWDYKLESEVNHFRIIGIQQDGSSHTVGTAGSGSTFCNYYYLKPYTMKKYYIIAYFKDGRRSKI